MTVFLKTQWKFQDFTSTQILREIKFWLKIEIEKTVILTILAALNVSFLAIFDISKYEISKILKRKSL